MKLDSYLFSFIGGRPENQDALGRREDGDAGIYVATDGLGGHQAGRLAADCTVDAMLKAWRAETEETKESFSAHILGANEAVLALQQEKNLNSKSTVAALAVRGRSAVWANVGDSRVYWLRRDRIAGVTADHSVAYKKYLAGEITRAEIASDEDQSSLLRVVGTPLRCKPDIYSTELLEAGDAFLLCTDGFWEYVSDEEILIDRMKADSARDWAELLLLRLTERIPPNCDNLSVITLILS